MNEQWPRGYFKPTCIWIARFALRVAVFLLVTVTFAAAGQHNAGSSGAVTSGLVGVLVGAVFARGW